MKRWIAEQCLKIIGKIVDWAEDKNPNIVAEWSAHFEPIATRDQERY